MPLVLRDALMVPPDQLNGPPAVTALLPKEPEFTVRVLVPSVVSVPAPLTVAPARLSVPPPVTLIPAPVSVCVPAVSVALPAPVTVAPENAWLVLKLSVAPALML